METPDTTLFEVAQHTLVAPEIASHRTQLRGLAQRLIAESGLDVAAAELADAERSVTRARAVLARHRDAARKRSAIVAALVADGVPPVMIAEVAGIPVTSVGRLARSALRREVRT